ncbi:MAG: phosphoserine phosphatase RsbU/P [Acidobacteriota bacterium]|jgi:serine phosphatase RsbU (regulator of sigma subunit)|nr:phosphoserine phosphatase RsbU/P [Acidobacteriota bacterium]
MSSRKRLLLALTLMLTVVGVSLAFAVARMHHWHEHGWTGVMYAPEFAQPARMTRPGAGKPPSIGGSPGDLIPWYGDSPAAGKVHAGDRIVSVNGIPRRDAKALRALRERLRRGDVVTYEVEQGVTIREVRLPLVSPFSSRYFVLRTAIAFLVALTFLAIAIMVLLRQPKDPRALVFYAFATVSAMCILVTVGSATTQVGEGSVVPTFGLSTESTLVFAAVVVAYPPLLLHLAMVFPKRRPILDGRPYVIPWIYAGAVLTMIIVVGTGLFTVRMGEVGGTASAMDQLGQTLEQGLIATVLLGLLLALQVIFAGRKQGIVQAFRERPFRAVPAIFAVMVSIAVLIAQAGLKKTGAITTGVLILLPFMVLPVYPVLAFATMVRSYRAANVEEKRQVQWPMWGLMIALFTRMVAYLIMIPLAFLISSFKWEMTDWQLLFQFLDILPLAISVIVPISFAVAILKYRLMNIDVIIRKTVGYAILSGAIVVLYLILVGGLGTMLVRVAGLQNQTMVIASTLVVALLFVPLRNKLQTLVDRNLFRHKYDYPEALRAISADALVSQDLGQFVSVAAEKVQQALQNRAVVIFTERHDEYVATAKVGLSDAILGVLRVPASFAATLDRPFDPRRRTLPEEAAVPLRRIESSLVVPVGTRGFVALAPKLSGAEFDVEDIDFLRSVADQLSMAVDRIRMHADEADFAQARAIQQSLLPREMPQVAGVEASGIWQPARTVGGDYYDLLKLSETELAFCIGDVAGKGMPAALLMSGLQAAVRASATPNGAPHELCERVRRVVVSSLSGGRFVTFFYATLDMATMRLRWCNAGHNAPILVRANGEVVRLAGGGSALTRLFRDTPFEDHEIAVTPGDRIVLFTDGVSEASDGAGEQQFGETALEELVVAHRAASAEALQRTIFNTVVDFSQGELQDDLTLVVVAV